MKRALGLLALAVTASLALGPSRVAAESICPANPEGGAFMKRFLITQVDIEAPARAVWDVLLDFGLYAEWNPFVTRASGAASVGEKLAVTIQPPGRRAMSFDPTLLVVDAPRELRWLGRVGLPRIFDGEHFFVLEPRGESQVRLVHGECFHGLLVPFLWKSLDTDTRAGFEQMNHALRERAEALFEKEGAGASLTQREERP
jgi:hypothetical protein